MAKGEHLKDPYPSAEQVNTWCHQFKSPNDDINNIITGIRQRFIIITTRVSEQVPWGKSMYNTAGTKFTADLKPWKHAITRFKDVFRNDLQQ